MNKLKDTWLVIDNEQSLFAISKENWLKKQVGKIVFEGSKTAANKIAYENKIMIIN